MFANSQMPHNCTSAQYLQLLLSTTEAIALPKDLTCSPTGTVATRSETYPAYGFIIITITVGTKKYFQNVEIGVVFPAISRPDI